MHAHRTITDGQVLRLVEQSAGVPLYAESLAVVHSRADATTGDAEPTREIAAVMEERLSFATPGDQRLLEVAIAVDFTFEVQYVADLARANVDDAYDRLDQLMREHHLIVEAGSLGPLDRYALSHPMLADALRRKATANPPRLRRLHPRLVDILLDRPVSDEIAVRAAAAATERGAPVHGRCSAAMPPDDGTVPPPESRPAAQPRLCPVVQEGTFQTTTPAEDRTVVRRGHPRSRVPC